MLNINAMLTGSVLKAMERAVVRAVGKSMWTMDIVQDAAERVVLHAAEFDESKGSFESWAMKIASNHARNVRRLHANRNHESSRKTTDKSNNTSKREDYADILVGSDGRATTERALDARWLADAVATLADDDRKFIEALADGMNMGEAAAVVGWSNATATRRYRLIVEQLSSLK